MARDPVCGMVVDEQTAARKTTYNGTTYYFCAPSCLREFLSSPEKYIRPSENITSSPTRGTVKGSSDQ